MLSMKTLRVAIVTMGSALLLGSGIAAAQVIELDGTTAAGNAPMPVRVAAESIQTAEENRTTMGTTVLGYNVNIGTQSMTASARASVPGGHFIRIALSGAVFRADPTVTGTGLATGISEGGALSSQAIIEVAAAGIARRTATGDPSVSVDIGNVLAVTSASPGSVTASITAHESYFDAIDGENPWNTRFFGGSATIINKVSGVTATVSPGTTAIADAAVGFRWFVNNPDYADDMATGANRASAHLGSFTVAERISGDTATIDAGTGATLLENVLVPAERGVQLRIEGDLGIGAFELSRDARTADQVTDNDPLMVTCPTVSEGSEDSPLMGNVKGTMDAPNVATVSTATGDTAAMQPFGEGGARGTYTLCVTVDTMGAMSNENALPATEFMGTILLPNANSAIAPRELATGVVGKIERNGASSNVAYLTTSDKHNQRLIIVNRSNRPVMMTDIVFQTEAGTEADLTDAAKAAAASPELGAIPANESRTFKVSDMVSITGNSRRAAAMISFNGTKDDISVATTQVNLADSSTDTVMWPVN